MPELDMEKVAADQLLAADMRLREAITSLVLVRDGKLPSRLTGRDLSIVITRAEEALLWLRHGSPSDLP